MLFKCLYGFMCAFNNMEDAEDLENTIFLSF